MRVLFGILSTTIRLTELKTYSISLYDLHYATLTGITIIIHGSYMSFKINFSSKFKKKNSKNNFEKQECGKKQNKANKTKKKSTVLFVFEILLRFNVRVLCQSNLMLKCDFVSLLLMCSCVKACSIAVK